MFEQYKHVVSLYTWYIHSNTPTGICDSAQMFTVKIQMWMTRVS